jgi:hypothetical protein
MDPITVLPPLRGEWNVINTPGDRVPSHGSHQWGLTYAYDFIKLQPNSSGTEGFHHKSVLDYLLGRVKLADCYGWGEKIYAPISGVIREVFDGVHERNPVHLISDLGLAIKNSLFFSFANGEVHTLSGNYLIIEGTECCALLAHAKHGSIKVNRGDQINAGDVIAAVGHSGNSTAPHLHFQLMDNINVKRAKGLPCCFSSYEIFTDDQWQKVECGVPSSKYKIRFGE